MKYFLFNTTHNNDINTKLHTFSGESTLNIAECDHIVYGGAIDSFFQENNHLEKIKNIYPEGEFLKDSFDINPANIDLGQGSNISFENEGIAEVSKKIKELTSSILNMNSFGEQSRFINTVGIELVQNALIYKKIENLKGTVRYNLIHNDDNFIITVIDSFGELSGEKILQSIKRAFVERTPENKESGAGLGLSMILQASDDLIFKIDDRKSTTIHCIMHKYKRLKDFKNKTPLIRIQE